MPTAIKTNDQDIIITQKLDSNSNIQNLEINSETNYIINTEDCSISNTFDSGTFTMKNENSTSNLLSLVTSDDVSVTNEIVVIGKSYY